MEWEKVSDSTYVKVEELPDGKLSIQGLNDQGEEKEPDRFLLCGNRWSEGAVRAIHRLTGEWLDRKAEEEATE